jgi:DNA-binding NarL/FixJ family response regulator
MTPKAEPRPRVGGACPVRVRVVEDFVPFRQFILSMLASMPDLRVIGEVSDGLEAVHKSAERQPDLVLLDYQGGHLSVKVMAIDNSFTFPAKTQYRSR